MSDPGNGFGVCKDCGVARWLEVEHDICSYCGGTGRDEMANSCIFCEGGEMAIETVMCRCEEDDEP